MATTEEVPTEQTASGASPEGRGRHAVVGIDGSASSATALRWAKDQADRFGPLRPVFIWAYPWWSMVPAPTGARPPLSDAQFQTAAIEAAERMVAEVGRENVLEPIVTHGSPGRTLVDLSETASLLVVGTRDLGRAAAGLLGSVGYHCSNHASVPVVIVPGDALTSSPHRRIVVGIDGSANAERALDWVLEHWSDETDIEAVYAWNADASTVAGVAPVAHDELARQADELASKAVEGALARAAQPDRKVLVRAIEGDPRTVLRATASGRADLVAVGARGRENVAYLLLGSVATALATHPDVATAIVR